MQSNLSQKKNMNRNWSEEFKDVLRDTDKNLENIKLCLQRSPQKVFQPTFTSSSGELRNLSSCSSSSLLYHENKPRRQHETSNKIVTTLIQRLDAQHKTIIDLKDTVATQSKQIQTLRETQSDILKKLQNNPSDGLDYLQEIEQLRTIVTEQQRQNKKITYDQQQINSFDEELSCTRKDVKSICQWIKCLEKDLEKNLRDFEKIEGSMKTLKNEVGDSFKNSRRSKEVKIDDLKEIKKQLKEISKDVYSLKYEKLQYRASSSTQIFNDFTEDSRGRRRSSIGARRSDVLSDHSPLSSLLLDYDDDDDDDDDVQSSLMLSDDPADLSNNISLTDSKMFKEDLSTKITEDINDLSFTRNESLKELKDDVLDDSIGSYNTY